jgi:modulator of FtsH protease HflK
MERNIQRTGLINLLTLLIAGVGGFAAARYSASMAGMVAVVFTGLGVLVCAVSWFQMRLEQSERQEKMELDELLKTHSSSAMFEARESEVFPAQRSREQFERFFVPIFTVLLCLLQSGGAFLLWRWMARPTTVRPQKEQVVALAVFGLFALVFFLLGKFSATLARLEKNRLLRPGASYLLLSAYIFAAVDVGLIIGQGFSSKADFYVAHAFCVLLALMAVETLINLILEMYRPRVKGKVDRPLYDSRLVGLLAQPEGLITTAAQALDYQFGFKVSETWFYRFFEKALVWLLLAQLGALILSTAIVFIDAGEQALLERFGRPVEGKTVLGPGAHLKWPWPIDKVYRFPTERIQNFDVGFTHDPAREHDPVVLWTLPHSKEENFLVANKDQSETDTANKVTGKRTPPVSLLTVSIPVQYQITNLLNWAYENEDASSLLQDAATREVVRYLTSADLGEVTAQGRQEAAQILTERIQTAADGLKLGARIVFVGLQDIHPPVKVAPDYEKVVGAIHTKQAKILAAQADAIRTNAMAQARATNVLNTASADSLGRQLSALAKAALFTNQIPAFKAAPEVYPQRAYLETFVRATANARKYILLTSNTHDVLTFDLQDKIRADFLELSPQK